MKIQLTCDLIATRSYQNIIIQKFLNSRLMLSLVSNMIPGISLSTRTRTRSNDKYTLVIKQRNLQVLYQKVFPMSKPVHTNTLSQSATRRPHDFSCVGLRGLVHTSKQHASEIAK